MPFQSPFNLPYFFRPNYRYNYYPSQHNKNYINNNYKQYETLGNASIEKKTEDSKIEQNTHSFESSECLFEIFGLKLYIDDVLIMCLLYFLYTEGVQDQELFICLILLLLS